MSINKYFAEESKQIDTLLTGPDFFLLVDLQEFFLQI